MTGGGRGVGAGIARELAAAGARLAVSARTAEQVNEIAAEVDGLAVIADVDSMVQQVESELGPIDLLVANAGRNARNSRLGRSSRASGGTCSR